MRKIRILGVQTHFKLRKNSKGEETCIVGGVDYARVIQPLTYLSKDKFEVDIVHEPIKKGGRFETVEDVAKYYDICYFSYIDLVQFYIQLKVAGIKHGMKMIIDLDDNIWDVDPTHPESRDFSPTSEKQFNRSAIILDADGVTVTNKYLKYKVMENVRRTDKDIEILPNFVDLTKYDYKKIPTRPKTDTLTIGYIGGSSHFPDVNKPEFVKAMGIIMDKYPQVRFKTTFYMPTLKARFGYKYSYEMGRKNVYRFIDELWTKMMSDCEIFVAPLSWSKYSRAKSYIKYLEYSAGKRPCVMEEIDPYNEVLAYSEGRGFQASTTEEWVKHLSYLIENPKERKEIGENAYNCIKENHTIQGNVKAYEDYFSKLVDTSKKIPTRE